MIRRALAGLAGFLTGEDGDDDGDHHIDFDTDPFLFALYISISVVLVCMAGLMSGLTLGLMSMDSVELEVLRCTGTSEEKRYAAIIMPASPCDHAGGRPCYPAPSFFLNWMLLLASIITGDQESAPAARDTPAH